MRRSIQSLVLGALIAFASACTPEDKCASVSCNTGTTCDPADGICRADPTTGTDAGNNNNNSGNDAGQNGQDAGMQEEDGGTTSDGGMQEEDGGVVVVRPDTCGSAEDIVFSGNTASFTADLTNALDDFSPANTCNSQAVSPELFYRFELTQDQGVTITSKSAAGTTTDPVIYLLDSTCAGSLSLDCADVDNANPASPQEEIAIPMLSAGTYYLVVEAWGADAVGRADITITLSDPQPYPDTCASVQPVPYTDGTAFKAFTNFANDDFNGGSCTFQGAAPGPDLVYSLSLTAESDVTMLARGAAPGVDAVIYIREADCLNGAEVACSDSFGDPSEGIEEIHVRGLPAGDYFVFIDVWDPAYTGPVFALVDVGPSTKQPNETCAMPTPLLTGGQATETFVIDPSLSSDEYASGCSSAAGELVYQFNLPTAKDVTVAFADPDGGTLSTDPVVFIREATCETGNEIACHDSFYGRTVSFKNQPAGDYFMFLESWFDQPGEVQVTVSATDSVIADTCATPERITIPSADGGTTYVEVNSSTFTAADDLNGNCSPVGATSGSDVVYELTTTEPRELTAVLLPVNRNAGILQPNMYLRDSATCATSTADFACSAAPSPGEATTLTTGPLGIGTHYLVVDGLNASQGSYELGIYSRAPNAVTPANDTCTGPITVSSTDTERATLDRATDDVTFVCDGQSSAGNDVVYTFTTGSSAAGYSARISVTSENATLLSSPMWMIREACDMDVGQRACAVPTAAAPNRASGVVDGLAPSTTYFLWVDSTVAGQAGPFELSFLLRPTPAAADTCATPTTLTPNTSGTTGYTVEAINDYDATTAYTGTACTEAFPGSDVVYQYTAGVTGTATVKVSPDVLTSLDSFRASAYGTGYDVGVAVLEGACGATTCSAQVDAAGPSRAETLSFPVTAGTTYFLVVDSKAPSTDAASRGRFYIEVAEQ